MRRSKRVSETALFLPLTPSKQFPSVMKFFRNFFLLLTGFAFSSCDNLTEEIYINDDGSGKYVFYSDLIPGIRKMTAEMVHLYQDSTADEMTLGQLLDENVWKDFPDVIDSVLDYSQIIPDSILDEPGNREIFEKMEFFMEGGRSRGYVNTGFRYEFRDFSELENMLKKVEDNQKNSGGPAGGVLPGLDKMKTDINYTLQNNVLSRRTVFLNKPELQQSDVEMLKMFMDGAKMKTIVHLPRKVKEVKGIHLVKKEDKTVSFQYSMLDYMLGNTSNDFEIVMEDK